MPELPEVETIRRQLAALVEGRTLRRVEILDARWSRPLAPQQLAGVLAGRRVQRLERRGKYLVWRLSGGVNLAQHLRMTGSILCEPNPEPAHVRVRIELGPARAAGTRRARGARVSPASTLARRRIHLAVVDPRRFGTGELLSSDAALEEFFATRLGLEPLDERFTVEHLGTLLRGRARPIKSLLLDQRLIAGVGNIYADEALFRARIHPSRPSGRLSREQRARLRESLIRVLREGIDARGASIEDFQHVDGVRGSFQERFLVHRRAGEPCVRCGRAIKRIVLAGRGTYVCETCQSRYRERKAAHRADGERRSGKRRSSVSAQVASSS